MEALNACIKLVGNSFHLTWKKERGNILGLVLDFAKS
jgi:hypothetical protein